MKNEWIFVSNAAGSVIPTFIRFVTNKSNEEIKEKFGSNAYYDDKGKTAVSLWYCDEYTNEYSNFGQECADWAGAYAHDINDPDLTFIKVDAIPVVDLDLELKKTKLNDTGDYDGWVW